MKQTQLTPRCLYIFYKHVTIVGSGETDNRSCLLDQFVHGLQINKNATTTSKLGEKKQHTEKKTGTGRRQLTNEILVRKAFQRSHTRHALHVLGESHRTPIYTNHSRYNSFLVNITEGALKHFSGAIFVMRYASVISLYCCILAVRTIDTLFFF